MIMNLTSRTSLDCFAGHLAYLSEASALHNSLVLHDETDAVTFIFDPSIYTSRVQVKVEHPLLGATDWEDSEVSEV